MALSPARVARAVAARRRAQRLRAQLRLASRPDIVGLSTDYGGWDVAADLLGPDAVCYLAGIGLDVSFDLHLIARFGCEVHACDPVPEAQAYARAATPHEPRFHLREHGLWSSDGTLQFHENATPGFVSHSATNIHDTAVAFSAPVRAIDSLMAELGHDHVDFLKLSVEGSELEILGDVLAKGLDVRVIGVEYAQPTDVERTLASVAAMRDGGYEPVAARIIPSGWKLTYVATRA